MAAINLTDEELTSIQVRKATAQKLRDIEAYPKESYENIVLRLLKEKA